MWPVREDQKPEERLNIAWLAFGEVVESVKEFLEVLQMQTHVDRVVVLRNGIELLRQADAVPESPGAQRRRRRRFL